MIRSILPLFATVLAISAPGLATEIVPVPRFDSIELRGGGNVIVVPGPAERLLIVDGNTRYSRFHVEKGGKLVIDACDTKCPSSYRLHVEIETPQVPALGVIGGGVITASNGFAPQGQLSAAIKGGGRIDTRALEALTVSAAVNGGGELLVRARATLAGAVKGGGHVRYWGNPEVMTAIEDGGSVTPGY